MEAQMKSLDTAAPEQQEEGAYQRKPYTTPIMKDFGSVAELTKGAFLDYFLGT